MVTMILLIFPERAPVMSDNTENANSSNPSSKKLGTPTLTALVVGAIIGSGIFSLPQNMAEGAGAGAILIAWVITFIGMFALTKIFEWLSLNRPDIDDGVYGYARLGFGNFMGFNAAWGYWLSILVGCGAGYLIIFFSTLASFESFSFIEKNISLGNVDIPTILVCELAVIWLVHFFVLRGVRQAAIINAIITIAKILPILVFLLCVALVFKIDTFKLDFWGTPDLGSVLKQVRSTMLFTVWVFLGIECATVYGTRAKNPKAISKATLYGFMITFILLAGVSMLSLGVVPQQELAAMKNPSMALVLEKAVGPWGAALIKIGLLVSLSGALLAWTLISTEMLYLSGRGKDHTSPKIFGTMNRHDTPIAALWLTNILVSLLLIYNYFNDAGYNRLIQLGSSMALIPYWLCAAFALQITWKNSAICKSWIKFVALVGTIYSTWLIYAGGLEFLLLSMILYTPGIFIFYLGAREKKSAIFPDLFSKLAASVIIILGVTAFYLLITGDLKL